MPSPPKPSHAFAQWQKIGEEKNQKAFTVAGPCGNFTRFPILLLPEKRQQAPEAKTVLLRRRLIYTERCVMEMLRRGIYSQSLPGATSHSKADRSQSPTVLHFKKSASTPKWTDPRLAF